MEIVDLIIRIKDCVTVPYWQFRFVLQRQYWMRTPCGEIYSDRRRIDNMQRSGAALRGKSFSGKNDDGLGWASQTESSSSCVIIRVVRVNSGSGVSSSGSSPVMMSQRDLDLDESTF
jgi:hypothetical protein